MPSKRWSPKSREQRARDILDAIGAIRSFTAGCDEKSSLENRMLRSTVERELITISEACTKIRGIEEQEQIRSDQRLENLFPSIPWQSIRGVGNILRHGHGLIDSGIIWTTVREDLSALQSAVEKFLVR